MRHSRARPAPAATCIRLSVIHVGSSAHLLPLIFIVAGSVGQAEGRAKALGIATSPPISFAHRRMGYARIILTPKAARHTPMVRSIHVPNRLYKASAEGVERIVATKPYQQGSRMKQPTIMVTFAQRAVSGGTAAA